MGGTSVPRLFSAFAARPKTRGYPTRRPSHVQNRNDTNFRVIEFVVNGVGESATQQSVPFVPNRMNPGIETKFTQIAENTFEKVVTNLHAVRILKKSRPASKSDASSPIRRTWRILIGPVSPALDQGSKTWLSLPRSFSGARPKSRGARRVMARWSAPLPTNPKAPPSFADAGRWAFC